MEIECAYRSSVHLPPPGHGLTSHQSQRGNNLIHATGIDRFYIRCLILSLSPPPPSRL